MSPDTRTAVRPDIEPALAQLPEASARLVLGPSRGRWLIVLNGAEPHGRQRFSLAHEFKHVLDNPFIAGMYPDVRDLRSAERAEQVCDYFAACLLMPRVLIKRTFTGGTQDIRTLARRFEVSQQAMRVRLQQIGLVEPATRCLAPEVVG